jgi:hypothetical protein
VLQEIDSPQQTPQALDISPNGGQLSGGKHLMR